MRVSAWARTGVLMVLSVALPAAAQTILVGSGTGPASSAKVLEGGGEINGVSPYPGFTGGVTVAHGDVNGDGYPDIVTGAAASSTHVKVFNGTNNAELHSFFAFSPSFTGGVTVATGDVNGDGFDDIIVGAGPGGGPQVRVFSGSTLDVLHDFFAYPVAFGGGVRVASADYDGDKLADIITGAGPGGGPHVKVFRATDLVGLASFFAFDPAFNGGVWVAASDVSEDGKADLVVGAGSGGAPQVRVFSGAGNAIIGDFFAFDPSGNTAGVRVGVVKYDGDPRPYLIAGTGSGIQAAVRTFNWPELTLDDSYTPFGSSTGGVFVSGWDARPTAIILGNTNLCPPDDALITVFLAGLAPWTLTWSDGAVTEAEHSPFTRGVDATGTYTITKVADRNHPTGRAEGEAIVASGGGPVFTTHPQSQTVDSGQSVLLTAAATGGSVTYQWYQGVAPSGAFLPGATSSSYQTPALTTTTSYYVRATNSSCSTYSNTATLTVPTAPPPAPTGVIATALSTTLVNVSWNAVSEATQYEVWRREGGSFSLAGTTANTAFADDGRTAGKSYLYKVLAKNGVGSSPFSAVDLATTVAFTDVQLSPGTTRVKVLHFTELRTAVNAVRTLAGMGAATYTNAIATGGLVRAVDLSELRSALDAARATLALPSITWTDATLTVGTTRVKATHVQQLRDGVR